MTTDQLLSIVGFFILLALFARGFRAARAIDKIYQADTRQPKSLILRTIRKGTWIKVIAAAWFGILTFRGIWAIELIVYGVDLLPFIRVGSLILAALVLDLPTEYLKMVHRIQAGEVSREPREPREVREVRETHEQLDEPRELRPARPARPPLDEGYDDER